MGYSDRELLARIIKCEAGGEGDNGMKAVACSIMNRVRVTGGQYHRVGEGNVGDLSEVDIQFLEEFCFSNAKKIQKNNRQCSLIRYLRNCEKNRINIREIFP